jgi:transglutaminase-like putative cysteine protease
MKLLPLLILLPFLFILPLSALAEKQATGNITMEFDLSSSADSRKETRLWIPYPLSDQNQLISSISVSGDYTESAVYSDRKYSTPMLYARWDKQAKSRKLTFSFHVVRREVIKKDFPAKEASWDPADYAMFLEPTKSGPINGMVKELADTITTGKTTVQGKARAIYDWICVNMFRDPKTKGCGTGDVCSLLASRKGKCTDIHSVFVALARAAGIPSREIFGIRLGKKAVVDVSTWQHCWAEFFLPGFGWVPVDPADVLKLMLRKNLKPNDAETAELREYFWGGWDPYRVELSRGRDLKLNPPQHGAPLNTFGYPYAETGNRPHDWLEPEKFSYTITFRE